MNTSENKIAALLKVPAEGGVYALVNEGAQILDLRIAQRASDNDMRHLTVSGHPALRGVQSHHT